MTGFHCDAVQGTLLALEPLCCLFLLPAVPSSSGSFPLSGVLLCPECPAAGRLLGSSSTLVTCN